MGATLGIRFTKRRQSAKMAGARGGCECVDGVLQMGCGRERGGVGMAVAVVGGVRCVVKRRRRRGRYSMVIDGWASGASRVCAGR